MAQEQARAAVPPANPPARGGGRGFLAGLLGGVLGAGGSIYALQVPEVREALPLPQAAELIVNPAAVARVSALEAELAQLRTGLREAEESGAIDTVSARVEQLSGEFNNVATASQLESLRAGLSVLAAPEGVAALETRLSERDTEVQGLIEGLAADLAALDDVAARAEALATVQAAVQGFEARVGALEAASTETGEAVIALETATAGLGDGAAELETRVAAGEAALIERSGEVTGRVDALARDVSALREALGAADGRLAQMQDDTGAELGSLASRVAAIDAAAATATAEVASLDDRVTAAETTVAEQLAAAAEAMDGYRADLTGTVEAATAGASAQAAAAEQAAAAARELAADTEARVAAAQARTQAAITVNGAASAVDDALATGEPMNGALTRLDGVDASILSAVEAERLDAARSALEAHVDGVPSAAALKLGIDNLAPSLLQAAAPASGSGGLMGTLNLRPRGQTAEVTAVLGTIDAALAGDDIAAAVAAAESLPDSASASAASWIDHARDRLAVRAARDDLLNLGRDLAAAASAS